MFRFFTIRKTIGLMLVILFLFTGIGVTSYLVYDKYNVSKRDLVDSTVWRARSGAQQQFAIYFRDTDVLQELLGQFLQNPLIQHAAVYDQLGNPISDRKQEGVIVGSLPEFADIRADFTQLEVAQVERDNPAGKGKLLEISVPLFSFNNPLQAGITREDFAQSLALARNQGAQHVVGYYLLGSISTSCKRAWSSTASKWARSVRWRSW